MKFAIGMANIGTYGTTSGLRALARGAESAGFDSLWTVEHVVIPANYQSKYPYHASGKMPMGDDKAIPDPLVWLTYVGAITSTLRLGTGILILPQRNPVVTAKAAATLDSLTGGRLELGVGTGWLAEEFATVGVPFEARGRRLEAYIDAMRALWTGDTASIHNEFVSFDEVVSQPRPASASVPIVVGGHSKAAARRAGRLGNGFYPGHGPVPMAELIALMRATAEECGRDPDAIEVTASGAVFGDQAVASVAAMAEIGVSRVVIPPPTSDAERIGDALASYQEEVMSQFS